jgi:hypothetical protein
MKDGIGQGMEPRGIFAALAKANRAVGTIGKNRRNVEQKFNFRGIDDVMNELHSALSEAGVFIITEPEGEPKFTERKTRSGSAIYHLLQKWKFTFCAEDGSSVSASFLGEALDMGDKATNKSSSIALKYVLLQMFLIPTQEQGDSDPDNFAHETAPQAQARPQQQRQGSQPSAEHKAAADEAFARCGAFVSVDEFARLRAQMEQRFGTLPPIIREAMAAGWANFEARQRQAAEQNANQAEGNR